jgi:DNA-binding GntR family transcriptional regulator
MAAGETDQMATANFLFYDVLVQQSVNAVLRRSITGVVHIVRLGARHLNDFVALQDVADAHSALVAAVRERDTEAGRRSLGIFRSLRVPQD